MSTYKKTQAIVLSSDDISENDKGFTVYTKDYGKLFVIARGGKKIKSKLAPHLQPFSVSDVMLAQGKRVNHLIEGMLQEDYSFIKENLSEIALGSHCLEVVDAFMREEQPDPEVFELLRELLHFLNTQPEESTKAYKTKELLMTKLFTLKFMQILGYQPYLDNCSECGEPIDPSHIYFDPQRGVLCQKHGIEDAFNLRISANALKMLRLTERMSLSQMTKISCSRPLVLEINHLVNTYLKQYLEFDLRSDVWLTGLMQK